ncbi:MAG: WGR domain-containing protein [Bacteroidia bacterium]|nr:WGR domain-containing protein [Bacteroidia bacterium]
MLQWLQQLIAPPLVSAPPAVSMPIPAAAPVPVPAVAPVRYARLIMVTAHNNNKFYEMRENGDGTFTATYGRVGSPGVAAQYPIQRWDSLYREKTQKGYTDQTHLMGGQELNQVWAPETDTRVQDMVSFLMKCARQSVRYHYLVTAQEVTPQQLSRAQELLDELAGMIGPGMSADRYNEGLLQLFRVIPRRMRHVQDHLIGAPETEEDIAAIRQQLGHEQETLDVLRGQVTLQAGNEQTETLLMPDSLGLRISPVETPRILRQITQLMGEEAGRFRRAFEVVNPRHQFAFGEHVSRAKDSKVALLWHGSRNENWLSILQGGLVLRPAQAVINGKMFGYGLYFADKCRKSLNYTSMRGAYWSGGQSQTAYLALYEVHTGRALTLTRHDPSCYELSHAALQKRGAYDSVFARRGADLVNNEYVVYQEAQCQIKYLIEVAA